MEMPDLEYYVLDNNDTPKHVTKPELDRWAKSVPIGKVLIAETHFMLTGTDVAGVSTYFTGCTGTPGIVCDPYLWETRIKIMGHPREMYGRYQDPHKAKEGHENAVERVSAILKRREKVSAERRDIEIPKG
jgi:hypothetical protein